MQGNPLHGPGSGVLVFLLLLLLLQYQLALTELCEPVCELGFLLDFGKY